jgi:hypothetical protein
MNAKTPGAKRHHYVPRLLLRRFSWEPEAENPGLWRIEKQGGAPAKTSVNNESVIGHFYRLGSTSSLKPTAVEEALALVEGDAVEPIRKLVGGEELTARERVRMAMFLFLQRERTPQARVWADFMTERLGALYTEFRLSDPVKFRAAVRAGGSTKSNEEIERLRKEAAYQLESGRLRVTATNDTLIRMMFTVAREMAASIAGQMSWFAAHAPAGYRYICSDHPLLIHDPTAGRERGAAWFSSPGVQVSLPLDPTTCLVLMPGPPTLRFVEADEHEVHELNLRTYASAQWSIYGPTQASVQDIRTEAKRNPSRVSALTARPPGLTVFERMEGAALPHSTTSYRPPDQLPPRRSRGS